MKSRGFVLLLAALIILTISAIPSYSSQIINVLINENALELDSSPRELFLSYSSAKNTEISVSEIKTASQSPKLNRWLRIEIPGNADVETYMEDFQEYSIVEFAELQPQRELCLLDGLDDLPNDPLAVYQWHLDAVNIFAAWDLVDDASGIVVACPDIGVDMDHPDLQPILWQNMAEVNGQSGVDDDGNGYIDDKHGWDAAQWDGDPDVSGAGDVHGTHAGGIAVAAHDNGIGITGMAPGARLMAVRAGQGVNVYAGNEAVIYAADNGADIISMSWGGYNSSLLERDIMDYAISRGAILLAAAGNEGTSNKHFPGAYDNVIAVASTDNDGDMSSFSNYGSWVDFAAPGRNIYSTFVDGYGFESGTSMSTPLAAGIVALIKAQNPSISQEEVRAQLAQSCLAINHGGIHYQTQSGRIDAWRALKADQPTIAITSWSLTNTDMENYVSPGETFGLELNLELFGGNAENVELSLVPISNQIISGNSQTLQNLQTGNFQVNSLEATVLANAENKNHPVAIEVEIDGKNDSYILNIPVDPHWRTNQGGDLRATFTDFGAIGYNDVENVENLTEGVMLTDSNIGMLFHGSVMISNGIAVADNAAFLSNNNNFDFAGEFIAQIENDTFNQYLARYTDINTSTGSQVMQATSGYDEGDFIFIQLDVSRVTTGSSQYYAAIFCDWDIIPLADNSVGWDQERRLSYMAGERGAAGILELTHHPLSGVTYIENSTAYAGGLRDNEKLDYMTGGTSNASSGNGQSDYSHLIAVDLGIIPFAEQESVIFALVAGDSVEEMLQAADDAINFYARSKNTNTDPDENLVPVKFEIVSSWPNPFNSSTNIALNLPEAGQLNVSIYNLLGQKVYTLVNDYHLAGFQKLHWNGLNKSGRQVAAGTYLLRARFENSTLTRKITFVK